MSPPHAAASRLTDSGSRGIDPEEQSSRQEGPPAVLPGAPRWYPSVSGGAFSSPRCYIWAEEMGGVLPNCPQLGLSSSFQPSPPVSPRRRQGRGLYRPPHIGLWCGARPAAQLYTAAQNYRLRPEPDAKPIRNILTPAKRPLLPSEVQLGSVLLTGYV